MRFKSFYFSHDSNARRDPKLIALTEKFGMAGKGMYWALIEVLSEQTDYTLDLSKKCNLIALSRELLCKKSDEVKIFIDECLNLQLLGTAEGKISSPSLKRRMKRKEELREKKKLAAHIRWNNRSESKDDADAMQTDAKENKVNQIKQNKNKEKVEGASHANTTCNFSESENDPFYLIAVEKLEEPSNQPWTDSGSFKAFGRQPMKGYPEVFISAKELCDVLKNYKQSGIPGEYLRQAFLAAQAAARTAITKGQSPEDLPILKWMLGWIKQQIQEELIKESRLNKIEGQP